MVVLLLLAACVIAAGLPATGRFTSGPVTVGVDGDKVSLTDAAGNTVKVTATDVEASNGVIHVIDGVLMPQ